MYCVYNSIVKMEIRRSSIITNKQSLEEAPIYLIYWFDENIAGLCFKIPDYPS